MDIMLPTTPGALLGYTSKGRPIYLAAGGSGEGDGGQAGGQATGQPAAGTGTPPANGQGGQQNTDGQPAGQNGNQSTTEAQDVSSLPTWAQKLLSDTRAEAASHRTAKQTAAQEAQAAKQQRDAILKAAGFTPDGKEAPPDVDTLAAQIEQQKAVAWTAGVELNVFRTAQAAGANGEALLDSRAFIDSLDEFTEEDPAAPDFRQKLDAHIKAYVEKHPQFKTQPQTTPPGKNGTDRAPGGNGGTRQVAKGLGAAIRAHYGG